MDLNLVLQELGQSRLPCPLILSANNLKFFEAGAFFQKGDISWIEINTGSYLSCLGYDLNMVLKHELIHALRKDHEDSIYEELIAYQVSKHKYQKILGPFLSLKRGKISLVLLPLSSFISVICNNVFIITIGIAFTCIAFGSYFFKYKRFQNYATKMTQDGKDALIELMKLTKKDFESLS